jgi:hypothetical protein
MAGHRTPVVRHKNAALLSGDLQNRWVAESSQAALNR